ncbi:MAG: peptidoglycan editing factor PgeF [Dyella sp.]
MPEIWVTPEWPAPLRVRTAVSTRFGPGSSESPYERFNLGLNSGERIETVQSNRLVLGRALALAEPAFFLRQVHGVTVHRAEHAAGTSAPEADAATTLARGRPLAILTADCLPVLFCGEDGQSVAAAHAGWRGLAAGVLEATVAQMPLPPRRLLAWLGPCIGQPSYEVGEEVHAAFLAHDPAAASAFMPTRPGHWLCDLAALARQRLRAAGVDSIYGGGFDTFTDARFYSYRRDGARSGRFASLIWID